MASNELVNDAKGVDNAANPPICERKFCAGSKTTHKTFFPTGLNSSNKLTVGFIMNIGSSVRIQELGFHDFLQAKKMTVWGKILVRHLVVKVIRSS